MSTQQAAPGDSGPIGRASRPLAIALSLATLLACVAAVVISVLSLATTYWPSLKFDEWLNWSMLLDRGVAGSIVCQEGIHAMVVPNLFYRINAIVFHGDPAVRASITWTVAALSGVAVSCLAVVHAGRKFDLALLATCAVPLALMTCLAQEREIFWGMSVHDHLPAIGAAIMAFGLGRMARSAGRVEPASVALIVFGGALASFSFGAGLAVWGALPLVWAVTRRDFVGAGALLVVGALVALFVHFATPVCFAPPSRPVAAPYIVAHALSALGGGFSALFVATPTFPVASVFALVALAGAAWASYIVWTERGANSARVSLLLMIWYAAGVGLLIGIGRSSFTLTAGGLNSRFFPFSLMLTSSLWLFFFSGELAKSRASIRWALSAATLLMALAPLQTNVRDLGIRQRAHVRDVQVMHRLQLTRLVAEQRILTRSGPPVFELEAVRVLPMLREHGWDLFRDPTYRRVGTPLNPQNITPLKCQGAIEPGTRTPAPDMETIALAGWARASDGRPAQRVLFSDGETIIGLGQAVTVYGDARADPPSRGALWAGAIRVPNGAPRTLRAFVLQPDGTLCAFGN